MLHHRDLDLGYNAKLDITSVVGETIFCAWLPALVITNVVTTNKKTGVNFQ